METVAGLGCGEIAIMIRVPKQLGSRRGTCGPPESGWQAGRAGRQRGELLSPVPAQWPKLVIFMFCAKRQQRICIDEWALG